MFRDPGRRRGLGGAGGRGEILRGFFRAFMLVTGAVAPVAFRERRLGLGPELR